MKYDLLHLGHKLNIIYVDWETEWQCKNCKHLFKSIAGVFVPVDMKGNADFGNKMKDCVYPK